MAFWRLVRRRPLERPAAQVQPPRGDGATRPNHSGTMRAPRRSSEPAALAAHRRGRSAARRRLRPGDRPLAQPPGRGLQLPHAALVSSCPRSSSASHCSSCSSTCGVRPTRDDGPDPRPGHVPAHASHHRPGEAARREGVHRGRIRPRGAPRQAFRNRASYSRFCTRRSRGAAIVFADSLDDFVTVRYLSGPARQRNLSR